MYTEYFGFSEKPFSIAPNPRYLYMSERHREALAHLLYGMQGEGGIVLLTGEVGTGKTTVCRCMLSQIPGNTDTAFIVNPKLSAIELLATVCDELHIKYKKPAKSIKTLTDLLNDHLLASHADGRHTVLIIDEAQNLDADVLEQLRLLTNLETDEKKLLQIILLGQPELAEKLQRKELRQLSQRITARFHLTPLDQNEVRAYIDHRLSIAEGGNAGLFPASVIATIYRQSGGIPRMINLIADRALLGAYASNERTISRSILKQAVREVLGELRESKLRPLLPWAVAAVLLLAGGALLNNSDAPADKKTEPAITEAKDATTEVDTVVEPEPVAAVKLEQVEVEAEPVAPKAIPVTIDRNSGFIPLFAAWNIEYDPAKDGPACEFAPNHNLACLRQQGGIADMRNLDRPALLTLAGEQGETHFTAVLAMSTSDAELANAESHGTIDLSRIALLSRNDFTILWRTPAGYDGPVRPGRKGAIVQLLSDKSAAAQNLQWIGGMRDEYDLTLKEQVKSFQRQQGLNPDGVAGPQTWIRINSLTGSGIPTLHRSPATQAVQTVTHEVTG